MVHLSCNEMIPADILVLRSSDEHGLCYIDTQNLDGEANLKQREVPRGFVDMVITSSAQFYRLSEKYFSPLFYSNEVFNHKTFVPRSNAICRPLKSIALMGPSATPMGKKFPWERTTYFYVNVYSKTQLLSRVLLCTRAKILKQCSTMEAQDTKGRN